MRYLTVRIADKDPHYYDNDHAKTGTSSCIPAILDDEDTWTFNNTNMSNDRN